MTSYTKESNDLKRSVIQTKCKETREETNEFMGWASQISKLNENTAFNLYTFTVKDRPQAVENSDIFPRQSGTSRDRTIPRSRHIFLL